MVECFFLGDQLGEFEDALDLKCGINGDVEEWKLGKIQSGRPYTLIQRLVIVTQHCWCAVDAIQRLQAKVHPSAHRKEDEQQCA